MLPVLLWCLSLAGDLVLAGPVERQFFSIQTSPPQPPSSTGRFGYSASSASSTSSKPPAVFPSSSSSSQSAFPATSTGGTAPPATLAPGQDVTNPQAFLVYNYNAIHYPFTVHVPDRSTRGLYPLAGPPPMILSLGGSGARGPPSQAKTLSGFDGTSRFIREYNEGNRSLPHTLAAEEFLTVTPICPNETAQADAQWDVNVLPNIIAQVLASYEVDLTRIYLTTYSMGARAAWNLLLANPNIFAASVISSGATHIEMYQMGPLLGQSIRNYYGSDDELGLANATLTTQQEYYNAYSVETATNSSQILRTRTLETVPPIQGADHLDMTYRPWDEDVLTDGQTGALSWLLTQSKPEGAMIPAYNASICTICIPPPFNLTQTTR